MMTRTPRSADQAEPRPPKRDVPPITAAAMAFRFTSPVPACWLAEARRAAAKTPPSAAKVEQTTKADNRIRLTLIPERRAASAFPPTANIERPHLVRVSA